MSFSSIFLSPFHLLFFIVVAGLSLGQIRVKNISLGIAGILFVSILVGLLIHPFFSKENAEILVNLQSTMKAFSKLGSSLFVSVIGLQTGFSLRKNSKKAILAFAIGILMSISAVATMLLIGTLDKNISYPILLGILCGALTSTPGLSSVCELVNDGSVAWGYGCAYLFGVILTVLFVRLFSPSIPDKKMQLVPSQNVNSKIHPEIMLIGVTALLGNILENIKISCLNVSLGATATTLIIGGMIGHIMNKTAASRHISSYCLNVVKNLGLSLFFVGTGFSTGMQNMLFDIKTVLYGILITFIAILCGCLFIKLIPSQHALPKAFVLAGGMTSSPAYGAIEFATNEASINCFSFAYFGALLSLILSIQILTR